MDEKTAERGYGMDHAILNIAQATELLGVSEKTMIKLLREEHIPARKIGREWRFSREALIRWLAEGDSIRYVGLTEPMMVSDDTCGERDELLAVVERDIGRLRAAGGEIRSLLPRLGNGAALPPRATLRVSYKQQRDVEKLEFKIYWPQHKVAGE